MKLIWDKNTSDAHRKQIEAVLKKYEWLYPTWLHRMYVGLYVTDELQTLARIKVVEQYRDANLQIFTAWLLSEKEEQENTIIHELVHLHNCPLFSMACRHIEDEKIQSELERYLEGCTEDLAHAIQTKWKN
jgi:hypothetical protein